jgi:hypothetical protein
MSEPVEVSEFVEAENPTDGSRLSESEFKKQIKELEILLSPGRWQNSKSKKAIDLISSLLGYSSTRVKKSDSQTLIEGIDKVSLIIAEQSLLNFMNAGDRCDRSRLGYLQRISSWASKTLWLPQHSSFLIRPQMGFEQHRECSSRGWSVWESLSNEVPRPRRSCKEPEKL